MFHSTYGTERRVLAEGLDSLIYFRNKETGEKVEAFN
jgi:hypothetical protein